MTGAISRAQRDRRLVAIGLVLVVLWDASGWDLAVARWFGTARGFVWRDAWWTGAVLHDGGRALAWVAMAWLLVDAIKPLERGPSSHERGWGVAATLCCLVAVPALKQLSSTSCPWDLAEFGGVAAHLSHWSFGVADGGGGRCFPSGHAVAAFAFFSRYFVLRARRPTRARAWLIAVCALGVLFAATQVARGAHFPSHALWSAWLCWTICVAFAHGRRFAVPSLGTVAR